MISSYSKLRTAPAPGPPSVTSVDPQLYGMAPVLQRTAAVESPPRLVAIADYHSDIGAAVAILIVTSPRLSGPRGDLARQRCAAPVQCIWSRGPCAPLVWMAQSQWPFIPRKGSRILDLCEVAMVSTPSTGSLLLAVAPAFP